jgi:hypothetical protein
MYIKNALIIILIFISNYSFSQIKIDDIGDGWKSKVESAISLIKENDINSYDMLIKNCLNIEFIIGNQSTTKPPNTIAISCADMSLNSINNIAAVLVHESYHLYLWNNKINMSNFKEEYKASMHEYRFLIKIEGVESWLINSTKECINNQPL